MKSKSRLLSNAYFVPFSGAMAKRPQCGEHLLAGRRTYRSGNIWMPRVSLFNQWFFPNTYFWGTDSFPMVSTICIRLSNLWIRYLSALYFQVWCAHEGSHLPYPVRTYLSIAMCLWICRLHLPVWSRGLLIRLDLVLHAPIYKGNGSPAGCKRRIWYLFRVSCAMLPCRFSP